MKVEVSHLKPRGFAPSETTSPQDTEQRAISSGVQPVERVREIRGIRGRLRSFAFERDFHAVPPREVIVADVIRPLPERSQCLRSLSTHAARWVRAYPTPSVVERRIRGVIGEILEQLQVAAHGGRRLAGKHPVGSELFQRIGEHE